MKNTFLLLILLCLPVFSQDLPGEDDIAKSEELATNVFNNLQEKSFGYLIEFYYQDKILDRDTRDKLYQLSTNSINNLKKIQDAHRLIQEKIETYEDDSWDLTYGKTRLWRRSENLKNQIEFLIQQASYIRAISLSGEMQKEAIDAILENLAKIKDSVPEGKLSLLRAKVRFLRASVDQNFFTAVFNDLEEAFLYNERNTLDYFEAEICRFKMLRPFSKNELQRVIKRFREEGIKTYPDLSLQFAFLELETGNGELLFELLNIWPGLTKRVSTIAYTKTLSLINEGKLSDAADKMSPVERELVIYQAILLESELLDSFIISAAADVSYQSKVVNFAAALKLVGRDNKRAFGYAQKAIQMKDYRANLFPEFTDLYLYTVAAAAGHEVLRSGNEQDRQNVTAIFDKYVELAGDKKDEELCFLYAVELKNERHDQSIETFKKIIKNNSKYAVAAEFEILVDRFENGENVMSEITKIFSNTDKSDKLFYADVLDLYCQSLAVNSKPNTAIDVLSKEIEDGITVSSNCYVLVLENYIKRAEQYMELEQSKAAARMRIRKILTVVNDRYEGNMPENTRLIYLEILSICDSTITLGVEGFSSQALLSIEYNRIRARDLLRRNLFVEAATIWGQLARSIASTEDYDNWEWSRAKYYQIKAGLAIPNVSEEDKAHSFDVLESDLKWINPFWKVELEKIKPDFVKEIQRQNELAKEAALKATETEENNIGTIDEQ